MEIPAFNIPEWFLWMIVACLCVNTLLRAIDIYYEYIKKKAQYQLDAIQEIKRKLGQ